MSGTPGLSASLEDYLEAIFNISAQSRVARVTEIAAEVGVSKSSVTGALRALSARGLVNYDPYSFVTLTGEGEAAARVVVGRHRALARFLQTILGLGVEEAEESACRLEHAMRPEILSRLIKFVEFIDLCPLAGRKFRDGFKRFFEGKDEDFDCLGCVNDALATAGRSATGRAAPGKHTPSQRKR